MPQKCYFKPNRSYTRHFNAKAVGRTACSALKNGETKGKIYNEVMKCLGEKPETECEYAEILNLASLILSAMAVISIGLEVGLVVVGGLALVRSAVALIPGMGSVALRLESTAIQLERAFENAIDITDKAVLIEKIARLGK